MPPTISLKDDVDLLNGTDGGMTLRWPEGRLDLKKVPPGLGAALGALTSPRLSEDELADLVMQADGPGSLPRFYFHLRRFGQLRLLRYSVVDGDRVLASLIPTAPEFYLQPRRIEAQTRLLLSRFTFARRVDQQLVLESPLALCRIELHAPESAALLAALARPTTSTEAVACASTMSDQAVQELLHLLLGGGLLCEVGPDDQASEDADLALRQWEFHDFLLHSRSRIGRHDQPYGGTFPFLNQIEPLPAIKEPFPGEVIALERPDLEVLKQREPSLTAVLESRKSVRAYGSSPVTLSQLGELLYRVARVRSISPVDRERSFFYESSNRPYPGGGACYELELYPVVNACDGLSAGLYHYDPLEHVLRKLRGRDELVTELIEDVSWVTGRDFEPQVVIGIAARFQRVSWKYQSMAYALVLKQVGVLYQTLYLVATAMGLAPCGVGGGQADRLSRAIETPYQVESAVGEFILGSLPRPER